MGLPQTAQVRVGATGDGGTQEGSKVERDGEVAGALAGAVRNGIMRDVHTARTAIKSGGGRRARGLFSL
jgi:hypothetical protein